MPDKGYWQRSPATDLKKPVNNRLACNSYFSFFLIKPCCFRCQSIIKGKKITESTVLMGFLHIFTPVFSATKSATKGQLSPQQSMEIRRSTPLAVPADGLLPRSAPQIHLCCRTVRCRKVFVPNHADDHILQTSVD